jgi:hypothetical protein
VQTDRPFGDGEPEPDAAGTASSTLGAADTRAADVGGDAAGMVTAVLEPLADLEGAAEGRGASVSRAEGARPTVNVTRPGDGTLAVTVDYGATPVQTPGGRSVSGSFVVSLNAAARTATITLHTLTVDGRAVSGAVTLSGVEFTRPGLRYTATLDLTFSGWGRIAGTLNIVRSGGTTTGFTIPAADLTVTPDGGPAYDGALRDLAIDPAANGSFVPSAGTATVSYQTTVLGRTVTTTALITYSAQSPATGQVTLSLNGAPAVPYTLLRFR